MTRIRSPAFFVRGSLLVSLMLTVALVGLLAAFAVAVKPTVSPAFTSASPPERVMPGRLAHNTNVLVPAAVLSTVLAAKNGMAPPDYSKSIAGAHEAKVTNHIMSAATISSAGTVAKSFTPNSIYDNVNVFGHTGLGTSNAAIGASSGDARHDIGVKRGGPQIAGQVKRSIAGVRT